MKAHYDGFPVTSRGAVFNFIDSNRNYGKTWTFKKRAFRRAVKRGRKTIWVRRFRKEAKEAAAAFFTSADLQKFCGVQLYDPETKQGNCRQMGNTFYVKRGNRWEWFLKVVALADSANMRGVDDVKLDTIVFDEYRTTPARYARYRGNEVTDFIDIFFSVKREHEVRCFFLGNKESTTDPYTAYFGIPPRPDSWEGIRTYRGGSICIQQINNKPKSKSSDFAVKVANLLAGTSYGNYIYNSTTKTNRAIQAKESPKAALLYVQLKVKGQYVRVMVDNGNYFVKRGYDASKPVYCDEQDNAPRHFILTRKQKKFFLALENAIADNRVFYSGNDTYELIYPFYKWLGI